MGHVLRVRRGRAMRGIRACDSVAVRGWRKWRERSGARIGSPHRAPRSGRRIIAVSGPRLEGAVSIIGGSRQAQAPGPGASQNSLGASDSSRRAPCNAHCTPICRYPLSPLAWSPGAVVSGRPTIILSVGLVRRCLQIRAITGTFMGPAISACSKVHIVLRGT